MTTKKPPFLLPRASRCLGPEDPPAVLRSSRPPFQRFCILADGSDTNNRPAGAWALPDVIIDGAPYYFHTGWMRIVLMSEDKGVRDPLRGTGFGKMTDEEQARYGVRVVEEQTGGPDLPLRWEGAMTGRVPVKDDFAFSEQEIAQHLAEQSRRGDVLHPVMPHLTCPKKWAAWEQKVAHSITEQPSPAVRQGEAVHREVEMSMLRDSLPRHFQVMFDRLTAAGFAAKHVEPASVGFRKPTEAGPGLILNPDNTWAWFFGGSHVLVTVQKVKEFQANANQMIHIWSTVLEEHETLARTETGSMVGGQPDVVPPHILMRRNNRHDLKVPTDWEI